jgi:hypothetical protein
MMSSPLSSSAASREAESDEEGVDVVGLGEEDVHPQKTTTRQPGPRAGSFDMSSLLDDSRPRKSASQFSSPPSIRPPMSTASPTLPGFGPMASLYPHLLQQYHQQLAAISAGYNPMLQLALAAQQQQQQQQHHHNPMLAAQQAYANSQAVAMAEILRRQSSPSPPGPAAPKRFSPYPLPSSSPPGTSSSSSPGSGSTSAFLRVAASAAAASAAAEEAASAANNGIKGIENLVSGLSPSRA